MQAFRSEERISAAYPVVLFSFIRFILDYQSRVTTELKVDLETCYVMGILSLYNLNGIIHPATDPRSIVWRHDAIQDRLKPARLTDIADVCRLPVETTRRKLKLLEKMERVQQLPDKSWIVRIGVDPHLREFMTSSIQRMLETAEVITKVLERTPPDTGSAASPH